MVALGILIVGGIAASGFLVTAISWALTAAGQLTNFGTIADVADALNRSGRPDLASDLLVAQSQGNTEAFDIQEAAGGFFGRTDVDLLKWGIIGFVALKVTKTI